MKKTMLALSAFAVLAGLSVPVANPVSVLAEGDSSAEVSVSESVSASESVSPSEASSESIEDEIVYRIGEAQISYRDSDDVAYTPDNGSIGSYFLSADGWSEDGFEPIVMTIQGNLSTKLQDKIVYLYEYRPTYVKFNGLEIEPEDNKTYLLEKPEAPGTYDLEIGFTREMIVNPVDLTNVNWASLFTVENMMTILSWLVIVVGILVIYALNRRYKKQGQTTLQEVETLLSNKIESVWGKEAATKITDLLDTSVKPVFSAVDEKLSKVDSNQAVLVRCLLLMQENTPQARLAITECLSKLDVSEDNKAEEVKKLIEEEIAKYKSEAEAKEKALEEAKKETEKWASGKNSETSAANEGFDGTKI